MGVKNEMYDLSEMIRLGHCRDVKCITNHCVSKALKTVAGRTIYH